VSDYKVGLDETNKRLVLSTFYKNIITIALLY